MTYRVAMVLTNNPSHPEVEEDRLDHVARFAGCRDENDARRKCRDIYGSRLVGIKSVKGVEE